MLSRTEKARGANIGLQQPRRMSLSVCTNSAKIGKWYLGIDERYGVNTKRRYKFPYGDLKNVHRCGLLAVRARARQYGYTEIESAAAELERAIKR
jgi:hypothetical protein